MTQADDNRKIDHIVVLMMENRSFDHMLKWHEEMILDGVPEPGEGLAIPHELTDFQLPRRERGPARRAAPGRRGWQSSLLALRGGEGGIRTLEAGILPT